MTDTAQATDNLKSITGLTEQEYDALTAALSKMRAANSPKPADLSVHTKMLSAVRNQLQQRLNSTTNLSDEERAKILQDIAQIDQQMNAAFQ